MASVATRAVHGGIDAARDIAVNLTATSKEAAGGAIDTVGSIATGLVGNAKGVLLETVAGAKDVLNTALPQPKEQT